MFEILTSLKTLFAPVLHNRGTIYLPLYINSKACFMRACIYVNTYKVFLVKHLAIFYFFELWLSPNVDVIKRLHYHLQKNILNSAFEERTEGLLATIWMKNKPFTFKNEPKNIMKMS